MFDGVKKIISVFETRRRPASSRPPFLPPSSSPSLPPSLSPSLPPSVPHTLPPSLSPSLPPSCPPSHPPLPAPRSRPPPTPPLPLRTLQLVAKRPETGKQGGLLRACRKVKCHRGFRESWPQSRKPLTVAPPLSQPQPFTEAQPKTNNQSQPQALPHPQLTPSTPSLAMSHDPPHLVTPPQLPSQPQINCLPAAPHSHWSVHVKAPPSGRGSEATLMALLLFCHSGSSNSLIAIDNKIEQAMDLVKSHLMLAVREEVEFLREQIRELTERNHTLERENLILRALTHS